MRTPLRGEIGVSVFSPVFLGIYAYLVARKWLIVRIGNWKNRVVCRKRIHRRFREMDKETVKMKNGFKIQRECRMGEFIAG